LELRIKHAILRSKDDAGYSRTEHRSRWINWSCLPTYLINLYISELGGASLMLNYDLASSMVISNNGTKTNIKIADNDGQDYLIPLSRHSINVKKYLEDTWCNYPDKGTPY
jgi:hypothetical protein